jgi:hypothetical protein
VTVLPVYNNVLGIIDTLSTTQDNDSNLIHSGIRNIVAALVTIFIKVKRYLAVLVRSHGGSLLKGLAIKVNSRMRLMKDALKHIQGGTIKGIGIGIGSVRIDPIESVMSSDTVISSIGSVMDIKLGVGEISTLERDDRASIMDELSMQDIRIRAATTLIDRIICCFANRSHGQGIVVKEDKAMKGRANRIVASEEVVELMWNLLKWRERDLALIAAHAKLGIDVRGT